MGLGARSRQLSVGLGERVSGGVRDVGRGSAVSQDAIFVEASGDVMWSGLFVSLSALGGRAYAGVPEGRLRSSGTRTGLPDGLTSPEASDQRGVTGAFQDAEDREL